MPRYSISHVTTFHYSHPVAVSHHSAHLKPLTGGGQTCHRFDLEIRPQSVDMVERVDYFGNTTQLFSIQQLHEKLVVEARSTVSTEPFTPNLLDFRPTVAEAREHTRAASRSGQSDELQFLYGTPLTANAPAVQAFADRFFTADAPVADALWAMLRAFKEEFEFDPTATDVNTPILESLEKRRGVCQDFAHLMIAAVRAAGLSARYCSGYILTQPPEGSERLLGADASHAWVSVFLPDLGWVQLDPTNNVVCSDQHVLVATGRDYSDVTMLRGAVTGGGEHRLHVGVTMLPIDVAPEETVAG